MAYLLVDYNYSLVQLALPCNIRVNLQLHITSSVFHLVWYNCSVVILAALEITDALVNYIW